MKNVEGNDSNNKQDRFHAEWSLTLTKRFTLCQASHPRITQIFGFNLCNLWMVLLGSRGAADSFRVDVVTLDHAIECFAIDVQHARGSLLVAARVLQHLRYITSLDLR